jgi:hypothetical protein
MDRRLQQRRGLRWAMVALGLVLGAMLIANGSVVIGALIATMAILRSFMLRPVQRRHVEVASQGGEPSGTSRQLFRPLIPDGFRAAASAIGVNLTTLRGEFAGGKSIAEVATDAQVPVDDVVRSMVGSVSVAIDQAVLDGTMSSRDASVARSRLPQWSNRLVTIHRDDLPRIQGSV